MCLSKSLKSLMNDEYTIYHTDYTFCYLFICMFVICIHTQGLPQHPATFTSQCFWWRNIQKTTYDILWLTQTQTHTDTHSHIKQMAALSITMEWHVLCLFYVMILLWSPSMSESRYITKNLDLLHLHAFNISGKRKKDKQPFNTLSGFGISLNRPFTTSPSHHEPLL